MRWQGVPADNTYYYYSNGHFWVNAYNSGRICFPHLHLQVALEGTAL